MMMHKQTDTLNDEISDFVSEQSNRLMESWLTLSDTHRGISKYSTYVHWSVCSVHIVLALFAISVMVYKRRPPEATKELLLNHTGSIFYYKLNIALDAIVYGSTNANHGFVDRCFEDNALSQVELDQIDEMHAFIKHSGEGEVPFFVSILKRAPARWFDCNLGELDEIVNYCMNTAINGAKLHKDGNIKHFGPKAVSGAQMVKTLANRIIKGKDWIDVFGIKEFEEKGNVIERMNYMFSQLNPSPIDYLLTEPDNIF